MFNVSRMSAYSIYMAGLFLLPFCLVYLEENLSFVLFFLLMLVLLFQVYDTILGNTRSQILMLIVRYKLLYLYVFLNGYLNIISSRSQIFTTFRIGLVVFGTLYYRLLNSFVVNRFSFMPSLFSSSFLSSLVCLRSVSFVYFHLRNLGSFNVLGGLPKLNLLYYLLLK